MGNEAWGAALGSRAGRVDEDQCLFDCFFCEGTLARLHVLQTSKRSEVICSSAASGCVHLETDALFIASRVRVTAGVRFCVSLGEGSSMRISSLGDPRHCRWPPKLLVQTTDYFTKGAASAEHTHRKEK